MYKNKIFWSSAVAIISIITIATSAEAQNHDSGGTGTGSPISVPIDTLNGSGIPNITTVDLGTGIITGGGLDTPVSFGSSSGSAPGSGSASGSGSGSGASSGSGSGSGSGAGSGSASGDSEGLGEGSIAENQGEDGKFGLDNSGNNTVCTSKICLKADGKAQKITLNDAAELLEKNLDDSLNLLEAAELAAETGVSDELGVAATNRSQDQNARRIARNSNTRRNVSDADPRRIARQNSPHGCGRSCANPDIPTVEARQFQQREIEAREVVERQLAETQKFIEQVNKIDPEKNIW